MDTILGKLRSVLAILYIGKAEGTPILVGVTSYPVSCCNDHFSERCTPSSKHDILYCLKFLQAKNIL